MAILVGAAARAPIFCAISGVALLVAASTQVPLFTAEPTAEPTSGSASLLLLTANVAADAADPAAIMRAISKNAPDVVALQELSPNVLRDLESRGLDRLLPYRYVHLSVERAGSGLWSRYTLQGARTVSGFVWTQIVAQVDAPGFGRITVASVHPVSPRPGLASAWAEEQERLAEVLTSLPGTVVAMGDFNATYDHKSLRGLRANGFSDAADQAGAGLTPTWPQWGPILGPLWGIDRVLVRGPLRADEVRVLKPNGSRHRPVRVRLVTSGIR